MAILYEKYNGELFSYFYRMTKNKSQSEDLVQNTFFRIIKYAHNFKGKGKFVYWMYSVARNIWIDAYRKKNPLRHKQSLADIDQRFIESNDGPSTEYELKEKKDILNYALDQLTPEKKEAIILSRYHDMKYKDIAGLTGCTENTVKSRVKRGISELQEIVRNYQSQIL